MCGVKVQMSKCMNFDMKRNTEKFELLLISIIQSNLYFNWPKLFHTFADMFTSIFLYHCIHAIIPHNYNDM